MTMGLVPEDICRTQDQLVPLPDLATLTARLNTLRAAAAWLAEAGRPGLPAYNASYYQGWVRRTLQAVGPRRDCLWLRSLAARWEQTLEPLLAAPTVIHGEFYPDNILLQRGVVYPVD